MSEPLVTGNRLSVTTFRCPLDDCYWEDAVAHPPVSDEVLAEVFGFGVLKVAAHQQSLMEAERKLAEHFRTHSTVDYLRTIGRLRMENEQLRNRGIDGDLPDRPGQPGAVHRPAGADAAGDAEPGTGA